MPSHARRDIFACRKSDIVRFAHSDIIFALALAKRNTTRQKAEYHCAAISLAARRI